MKDIFWRPVNDRISELWARCSNCRLSAATMHMTEWHHQATELDLWMCQSCMYDPNIRVALTRQGWQAWDR